MRKTAFTVQRDGLRIVGTRYEPRRSGNHVPVIISHGFLSTRKSVAGYAKQFARWGYTAYTFDFIGGAPKNDSDGCMTQMSVLTEKEDLLAVMDYVRRDGCDYDKLILMGCSQGGFVSAMVAAEHRDEVTKLILFYPALCIPDDARRGKMIVFRFDPAHVPELIPAFHRRLTIGKRYVQDAQSLDPMEAIASYDGDVLIVHGTADKIVDLRYSERAASCFAGHARLFPIQKAGHGFTGQKDTLAKEVLRQFLLGREEVLTVDVRLKGKQLERRRLESTLTLPFDGSVDGPFFTGTIQPGAADVQKRRGIKPVSFCAYYTITGTDCAGKNCSIHVTNRTTDGAHWTPEIRTDSEALGFLNTAACEAILESRKNGPIVHIFARKG